MKVWAWKIAARMICTQQSDQQLAPLDQIYLEAVDPQQAASLDAVTQLLPSGAYTSFRTFAGSRVLHLDDHFTRLENTAAMIEKPTYLQRNTARKALKTVLRIAQWQNLPPVEDEPITELRLVIQQLGSSPLDLSTELLDRLDALISTPAQDFRLRLTLDLQEKPGDLYLALQPLTVPGDQAYREGVPVLTHPMQRLLPKAKLTRFIQRSGPVRQAMPAGVNETLMVDEAGYLLEGLSSNFFAVIDGEIWTAEEGVLSGITRSLVLEGVRQLNLPLRLQPARLADAPSFQEAFITSSSRAVLPVSKIDDCVLPASPGPLTAKLMQAYARAVDASLEEIY